MYNKYKYNLSLTDYKRFPTREVFIGDIPLGGNNPIRIQSMTTTDTMDTIATVEQSIRMFEAGSEYVRITAPSIKDAENLSEIKKEIKRRGYSIPLIADIHFTPKAAEIAATIVEKVRVNPGNYIDKKKNGKTEYTNEEYQNEIDKIRERFSPLVKICKEYGTAMRIGTNHGSLSERILTRYGDTPEGMVESAMEFVNICRELDFHDIVLSMKASNTRIMVAAYRLLMNRMIKDGINYPLHLGVTEAGDGMDGRIKSASGIGALLEDGIGDTIRVSLTEPPENELPVAKMIVSRYSNKKSSEGIRPLPILSKNPFAYAKRKSFSVEQFGGSYPPMVIADLSHIGEITYSDLNEIGFSYSAAKDIWQRADISADAVFIGDSEIKIKFPPMLKIISNRISDDINLIPIIDFNKLNSFELTVPAIIELNTDDIYSDKFSLIANKPNVILKLNTKRQNAVHDFRRAMLELSSKESGAIKNPVILSRDYSELNKDEFLISASVELGALMLEGFGDGVWININPLEISTNYVNQVLFGILQAARVRISKTEYISCPSCGRTLFDLVEVTNKIREKTSHLKGVKIGIMGCIVNGPGEMADADYGYVGSGPGKITLYKGQEIVRKNLPSDIAVTELINLIKENGDWVDK